LNPAEHRIHEIHGDNSARPNQGAPAVTDRIALILLTAALATLTAALTATAAGYLARRDRATWPQAINRAATAFAATLSLTAAVAAALHSLIR
jgi:hypothetical protein